MERRPPWSLWEEACQFLRAERLQWGSHLENRAGCTVIESLYLEFASGLQRQRLYRHSLYWGLPTGTGTAFPDERLDRGHPARLQRRAQRLHWWGHMGFTNY